MPKVVYRVTMDGGEPEDIVLFRPDPQKVITSWALAHGYKPGDCKTSAFIHRSEFEWVYAPRKGGFFSDREHHVCKAIRIDGGTNISEFSGRS